MFWTDTGQAAERLTGTLVTYDNAPCYVREITDKAHVDIWDETVETLIRKTVDLSDEKFNSFRKLPKLGWFNRQRGKNFDAVYLSRTVRAGGRRHGLYNENTRLQSFYKGESLAGDRAQTPVDFMLSFDYQDAHTNKNHYPALSEVLTSIEESTALAISLKLCVHRDIDGVRWLYRKNRRIGMFPGAGTLTLFPKKGFYRDELMAEPNFDIDTIQEF